MLNLDQLPEEERKHYMTCPCGAIFDMRNLGEVFQHLHADLPEPQWSHSVRKGDPCAWPKQGGRIDLN